MEPTSLLQRYKHVYKTAVMFNIRPYVTKKQIEHVRTSIKFWNDIKQLLKNLRHIGCLQCHSFP
jgi:hypothetical protein